VHILETKLCTTFVSHVMSCVFLTNKCIHVIKCIYCIGMHFSKLIQKSLGEISKPLIPKQMCSFWKGAQRRNNWNPSHGKNTGQHAQFSVFFIIPLNHLCSEMVFLSPCKSNILLSLQNVTCVTLFEGNMLSTSIG
jgi:hypothetical protein